MNDAANTIPPALEDSPLTRKINYATFNSRMFAGVVDVCAVTAVAYPLCEWLVRLFYAPVDLQLLLEYIKTNPPPDQVYLGLWNILQQQHFVEIFLLNNLFQILFLAGYFIPLWVYFHTTPGKFLVGIEIRDYSTNSYMTTAQAIKRFLGYILSGIPLTFGFLAMLFNRKRQGWHDKIANTIVVSKEKKLFSLKPRSGGR